MAVEGRFSTLLLRARKGKAAARSLEMSGGVSPRPRHPSGFTSGEKRRVRSAARSEGAAGGRHRRREPSLPLLCPSGASHPPSQKKRHHPNSGAETGRGGTALVAAGTHSLTPTPGFSSSAGNAAVQSTLQRTPERAAPCPSVSQQYPLGTNLKHTGCKNFSKKRDPHRNVRKTQPDGFCHGV